MNTILPHPNVPVVPLLLLSQSSWQRECSVGERWNIIQPESNPFPGYHEIKTLNPAAERHQQEIKREKRLGPWSYLLVIGARKPKQNKSIRRSREPSPLPWPRGGVVQAPGKEASCSVRFILGTSRLGLADASNLATRGRQQSGTIQKAIGGKSCAPISRVSNPSPERESQDAGG